VQAAMKGHEGYEKSGNHGNFKTYNILKIYKWKLKECNGSYNHIRENRLLAKIVR
jgi:hypothetical protein